VSELSRASGVSVPTIKYYLREGLLPPGRPTARNQADYDESHLHRLRLIRALVDVGGLGIGAVGAVLQAVGDESLSVHELLGVAHQALGPPPDPGPVADDVMRAREDVDRFLSGLGWRVSPEAPSRRKLADALVALRRLGRDVDTSAFVPCADVAEQLAGREVAALPADAPRAELVEAAVVGTVVYEAALVALRKLAHEHHSATRFGPHGRSRVSRRRRA
jgi:DNA-binding transcriptional MerR regulator